MGKDIPTVVNTELRFALYERKKNKWELFKNSAEAQFIALDDYTSMGTDDGQPGKDYSFSSSVKAENYIPRYLTNADELLYPIGGDTCTVIYRYYAGSGKYRPMPTSTSTTTPLTYGNTVTTSLLKQDLTLTTVRNGCILRASSSICP